MTILVGNNSLGLQGGSETYAYALIKALHEKGHTVSAIGQEAGIVSQKLQQELNIPCYFSPQNKDFDLLLLSHSTSIDLARNCNGFKVQTCHGIFPTVEQPVSGLNKYVAISEEVQQHLTKLNFRDSTVILNGIDCKRYAPTSPISTKLKTVLSLAQSNEANAIIRKACDIAGVTLIERNKYKKPTWGIEELINSADLVISLGRGAFEAMSCARNVIVFDYRHYSKIPNAVGDGILTKENISLYLKNNCSGRYSMKTFTAQTLVEEILKYNPQHGADLRSYALKHLNIDKQADKYIQLLT